MTDLQTLVVMFGRADVQYSIAPTKADDSVPRASLDHLPAGITVTVARADGNHAPPRIFGFVGFYAEFYFDDDGALVGVGAWE